MCQNETRFVLVLHEPPHMMEQYLYSHPVLSIITHLETQKLTELKKYAHNTRKNTA